MNFEELTEKEVIQKVMDVGKDSKTQNERLPMEEFVDQIDKVYDKTFLNFEENENDPPDYFLHFENGIKIGLEVTTLIDKQEQRYQEFYRLVDSIIKPILEQHKSLLQKGSYFCYYSPGSENNTKKGEFKFDSFDHKYNISKDDLKNFINNRFPIFLKNYDEKHPLFLILNRKNKQVGRIRLSKISTSNVTNIVTFPQEIYRMDWTVEKFVTKLQEIIDRKIRDYKFDENWLLISDINTSITTESVKFNEKEIKFKTKFFDRLFLIQDSISNYNIIELEIE